MFYAVLSAERQKLRRSAIWLTVLILPIISAVMGTFNYLNNTGILTHQWYGLWTQHTLFYCYIFFPAIIGVLCAYLCRLEHFNHNWNTVMTYPVPVAYIFLGKLASAAALAFCTQLFVGVLFLTCGLLCGFTTAIPPQLLPWLFCGWWAAAVLSALQLCLSLVIRSFAIPVGLALICGIAGLAIQAKGFGLYFPYSYISLAMNSNNPNPDQLMQCSPAAFFFFSTACLLLFCGFGITWLKRNDVNAS